MKTEYIPGQQIREFIETIQLPADCEQSFKYGFYSGDYSVTNSPYPPPPYVGNSKKFGSQHLHGGKID